MRLRDRLTEAIAEVLDDVPQTRNYGLITRRSIAGPILDTLLIALTDHADEWDALTYTAITDQSDLYDSGFLVTALAILRDKD